MIYFIYTDFCSVYILFYFSMPIYRYMSNFILYYETIGLYKNGKNWYFSKTNINTEKKIRVIHIIDDT